MKKCKICGCEFENKGRALYCPECRPIANRNYATKYRETHRQEYNAYMRDYMRTGQIHYD